LLDASSKLASQAASAVDAIAQAILSGDYPRPTQLNRPHRSYENLLLYGYLAHAHPDTCWSGVAAKHLDAAIQRAYVLRDHIEIFHTALYGGSCGLGWTIEHLVPLSNTEPDFAKSEQVASQIDALVIRKLQKGRWKGKYDLIGGLVGYGVYFLERWPAESARLGIQLVVEQLAAAAERTGAGITWHTSPDLLPAWQRELAPRGYYNLGVAHGVPGVIQFLNEVAATGIDYRALDLLQDAVRWLVAQQRPRGSLSRFSSWIATGDSSDSRLAWCYGDLGIAAVLLQVARREGRRDWQGFAYDLLDHCLEWNPERSGVKDAGLCHGAAGVAHIFNRIFQSEHDRRFGEASIGWFERTLAMRQTARGIGGFLQYTRPERSGPALWESSPAFLDGAIGIALALLAATTPVEPNWDRLLLL